MSAGDLVNNLGKLEFQLKQVNFVDFRRSDLLSGTLDIYVSIYGYVFSNFNPELSKLIASHQLELYGKTSKRFVDNLYLIVRDILHHKPPITKEMLLSKCGFFVEMKMIMCAQILELVLAKCKELPSFDKNKKNSPTPGHFSSRSSSSSTLGNNSDEHTDDSDCENVNNATTSSAISDSNKSEPSLSTLPPSSSSSSSSCSSMQSKKASTVLQADEQKLNSVITENAVKTNNPKPKNRPSSSGPPHRHLSSKLAAGRDSSEIRRHSISNDCAIAKNPVSKCNVAGTSSYAKGKAVVLEKQEPPPQNVKIKVLKGPLQIDDGFSGVSRIIPPAELSSHGLSFCQGFIPSARSSVTSNPETPAEQSPSIPKASIMPNSAVTTTTTPRSTDCVFTRTTPGSEGSLLTFLNSTAITKPRKVRRATIATIPESSSTTKLKCTQKDNTPTESKFVENTTVSVLKHSDENNQPKEINSTSSSSSSSSSLTQAAKALSQIKDLSKNLTEIVGTFRQMRARSQQWDTHNAFRNGFEQNKENTPTLNKETIPVELSCESGQEETVGVSKKTKESEEYETQRLNHWTAKMKLMECAVKSLDSKLESLRHTWDK